MNFDLYNIAFYVLWIGLGGYALARLLLFKRDPAATLAWIFFLIIFPIAGALIFLLLGPQRLIRKAFKRKSRLLGLKSDVEAKATTADAVTGLDVESSRILKLARQISEYSATTSNAVEILPDPERTLKAMHHAIEKAKKFIHLEYYIISSDEVTAQLFDALIEASKRGVEVRILYDALGSLSLKKIYFRRLAHFGIKISGFLPLTVLPQRLHLNFRNHRKILVIDGELGFTGGTNIGKEYLGRRHDQQWRDFSVRISGPACLQLQDVFAKDWAYTTKEDLFHERYFPKVEGTGDDTVQVLESGPDTVFQNLHQIIFLAITTAEKQILLTTPYFIPDQAIMSALTVAALRGVEVIILLPLKTDSKVVQHASRSFYEPLLLAGAKIHEYEPTKLHSKMLVIDDRWTILGSGNMDIRSFRLNFEINLLVRGGALATQAHKMFATDLAQSREITLEEYWKRPITTQLIENACRLLSPIL